MSTTTPNLLLNKPALGETPWGALVNANWDTLDDAFGGPNFAIGSYALRNFVGFNDAGTPNTVYSLNADLVVLRIPSSGLVYVRVPGGAMGCNLGVVGANGIDAGVQAASQWYYFYFIFNPTTVTLATICSLTAPSSGGPTLPAGYTAWAYACAVYSSSGTALLYTVCGGANAFYPTAKNILTGGKGIVETTVSLSTLVPPNATSILASLQAYVDAENYLFRVLTGQNYFRLEGGPGGSNLGPSCVVTFPNIAQRIFYIASAATARAGLTVNVLGFTNMTAA